MKRLAEKAKNNKVIDEKKLIEMSDQEKVNLIFLPNSLLKKKYLKYPGVVLGWTL